MASGDCSPAWAPDGSYLLNTARTASRPVRRVRFYPQIPDVERPTEPVAHWIGLSTSYKYYIHGQRVANDGNWVAFGGILYDGPKANGKREIYLWRVNDAAPDNGVRFTFDSTHDEQPSLFVGAIAREERAEGADGGTARRAPVDDGGALPGTGGSGPPPADGGIPATEDGLSPYQATETAAGGGSLSGGCSLTRGPDPLPGLLVLGLVALLRRSHGH
jgi:hypothetical protein